MQATENAVQAADRVIVFGASLNPYTQGSGALLDGASLVQCDTELAAIGLYAPAAVGVIGDAAIAAAAMLERVEECNLLMTHEGWPALVTVKSDTDESSGVVGVVNPRLFLEHLNALLPTDRIVALDGGRFLHAPVRSLDVPGPSSFVWTLGFGSIGLGLAAAIGSALAKPDRPALAVLGDGGFMMSLAEFSTAVRHQLDVIVVVLNDGAYGAEYDKLRSRGEEPGLALFDWPELADVAEALGGTGIVVNELASSLPAVSDAIAQRSGPLLIDVRCEPTFSMGATGRRNSSGGSAR